MSMNALMFTPLYKEQEEGYHKPCVALTLCSRAAGSGLPQAKGPEVWRQVSLPVVPRLSVCGLMYNLCLA